MIKLIWIWYHIWNMVKWSYEMAVKYVYKLIYKMLGSKLNWYSAAFINEINVCLHYKPRHLSKSNANNNNIIQVLWAQTYQVQSILRGKKHVWKLELCARQWGPQIHMQFSISKSNAGINRLVHWLGNVCFKIYKYLEFIKMSHSKSVLQTIDT